MDESNGLNLKINIEVDQTLSKLCMNIIAQIMSMDNEKFSEFQKMYNYLENHWNGDIEDLPDDYPIDIKDIVEQTKVEMKIDTKLLKWETK